MLLDGWRVLGARECSAREGVAEEKNIDLAMGGGEYGPAPRRRAVPQVSCQRLLMVMWCAPW
jgi:hypothetical protein